MQIIRNTPQRVREIPSWVLEFLPEHRRSTGVIDPMEFEKINFSQILPIVISFAVTLGFILGLISMLFLGFNPESLVITALIFISVLAIIGWQIMTTPVTNIELGWTGVLLFFGQPINVLVLSGKVRPFIPRMFFGKPLLEIIVVPTINETVDVEANDEKPPTSKDLIALDGEITYTYEAFDLIAMAPYIRPVEKQDEQGAEKALEGIKTRVNDLIRSIIFKTCKQLTYPQIAGSDSTENDLNKVYWRELTDSRKLWHICRHQGNLIPSKTLTADEYEPNDDEYEPGKKMPLGYTIHPGDVVVMQGGRIRPMRNLVDQQFWQSSFDRHGEHVFSPEWGIIINDSWVQGFIAQDREVHKTFLSRVLKQKEGEGQLAMAVAYKKMINEIAGQGAHKERRKEASNEARVLLGKKTESTEEKVFGLTESSVPAIVKLAEAIGSIFVKK